MFGYDLPNSRDQFYWDFHHGKRLIFKSGFILCHGFFFALLFVVGHHASNSIFIPSKRILALFHHVPRISTNPPSYAQSKKDYFTCEIISFQGHR